jgi:hypothetical protein
MTYRMDGSVLKSVEGRNFVLSTTVLIVHKNPKASCTM